MKKILLSILKTLYLDIIFFLGIGLLFAIPWGFKNYPMQFNWNVFFVLSADTSGADNGTGLSILVNFIIPSILVFIIYKFLIYFFIKDEKQSYRLQLFSAIASVLISTSLLFFTSKFWKYIDIFEKVYGSPVETEFLKENFISNENFSIIPPEKKKNLVLIFLESMEPCLATVENGGILKDDIIPNISEISRNNISFGKQSVVRGGQNLQGTAWTVAGILSKTSGIPFFNPFVRKNDKYLCLPNHKKLGDFLYDQGYDLIFSMGSKKQFENRDSVLETQHFQIHDIEWYKENNFLSPDYEVFWGFEDSKLYDFARKEIEQLSSKENPFVYGMLTVDTHFPDGYTCDTCENIYQEKIENVFHCADRQLSLFLDWAKNQEWYNNTTIVILGDHAYLNAPLNNFIIRNMIGSEKDLDQLRGFIDIFINSERKISNEKKERICNSFDMLPTILESMGNTINGKGMYLGRSMFSEEPSLSEIYSQKEIESETMIRSKIYESLK